MYFLNPFTFLNHNLKLNPNLKSDPNDQGILIYEEATVVYIFWEQQNFL